MQMYVIWGVFYLTQGSSLQSVKKKEQSSQDIFLSRMYDWETISIR